MSRRSRFLLLISFGFLLFVGAYAAFRWQRATATPSSAPLPPQIAGQTLWVADYGERAAFEISQLHASRFPMTSAAVGIYQGEQNAQLWVSGFFIPWMARQMEVAMQNSILENPDLPFRLLEERTVGGRDVVVLEGMGQQHFFFTAGNLVIWLAADPPIAEQALEETLQFYDEAP